MLVILNCEFDVVDFYFGIYIFFYCELVIVYGIYFEEYWFIKWRFVICYEFIICEDMGLGV